jgi:hypothetical protein
MTASTLSLRPQPHRPLARLSLAIALSAVLGACGGGYGVDSEATGQPSPPAAPAPGTPGPTDALSGTFATHQAAANWIGQAGDTGEAPGTTGATLNVARGTALGASGRLYVSDQTNQRVLVFDGIPTASGATASFALGAADLTSTGWLKGAAGVSTRKGRLALALSSAHQVALYNTEPLAPDTPPDVVLGQADTSGCAATRFNFPSTTFFSPDGKFLVADRSNHRVLIWNTVPTSANKAPDMVLGQSSLATCAANDDAQAGNAGALPSARTLNAPNGIWTDGTRLVIVDTNNSRVLIWNTFPALSFEPADIVLGQEDFTSADLDTSASGLALPNQVAWNGRYLAVSDTLNNRVLLWDGFPTASATAAGVVLGQPDFETSTETARDAFSLTMPTFVTFVGNTLLVTETGNRIAVFKPAP